MRIEIDGEAWDKGFYDGEQGKSLFLCAYEPGTTESLSWVSGYIEGKAARNGYSVTRPGDGKKPRPAAGPPTIARPTPPTGPRAGGTPHLGGTSVDRSGGQFTAPMTQTAVI
jgi:ribosome modulation factor